MDYVVRLGTSSEDTSSVTRDQLTQHIPGSIAAKSPEITPQILAVIQEAVTAFIGRKVRILSIRVGSEPSPLSEHSWAGQGRDIIHGSHNLVQRGRRA